MAHHMSGSVPARSSGRRGRAVVCALGLVATLAMAVGCGAGPSSRGELGEDQRILAACDPSAPPASLVEIDGTGSSASEVIAAERMTAIEAIVRRTAVCSGQLRVIVFSSSSAATTVLFEGSLRMQGATDNSRLKRVPKAVTEVMNQIQQGYGPAVASLPGGGSDITAEYRLASEWIGQLGGSYRLHLTILSDGCQNIGVDICARPLSTQEAAALADRVTVPQMPGASVVVAGLGRIAEGAPPSSVVEGLVAYYDAVCRKTTATGCVSVTDYATEGR